ncbi:MAG: Phage exclusion protein [Bacteroidetes bacterium]|jgi:predicted KAP-like P-loop ATPase|nr:Phage exclusion protein [Bacteroidota bacterium]
MNSENYSADTPISAATDDKFQRYEFSRRIAETVKNRKAENCLVVGVYGAWGEGKTSVINFIENELKTSNDIVVIKFNPWRYGDENALLTQFFNQFAETLDANLQTSSEKVGKYVKKYGKFLNVDIPFIGNSADLAESIGEGLANVNIETLKERIEKIILDSKKKIVIFIDDIDRLDKSEIYSVFRLVKLTADFKHTTYILSFDEEMVASAIGERFGEGSRDAGRNFLEKIVQVPLKIPTAQPNDLKSFCTQLLDNIFDSNKIELEQSEINRFVIQFTENVLLKLNTPRLAVRYANSLSFSIPLLNGEVNLVDLMLIEAVKTFYPLHYSFIKENPEYFINSYNKKYSENSDEEKKSDFKNYFAALNQGFTRRQQEAIKELLMELFPLMEMAFRNVSYSDNSYKEWIKGKRIASAHYFNRYFSYSVIKGEVSDVAFKNLVSNISTKEIPEIAQEIKELVAKSSSENFLFKMRIIEEDFNWSSSIKLAKALCSIHEIFKNSKKANFFGFEAPEAQAAIFIKTLIKANSDKQQGFELAKNLLKDTSDFSFADELYSWFLRKGNKESLFEESKESDLSDVMLERAKKEAGDTPLFIKLPLQTEYLLRHWSKTNNETLKDYLSGLLGKNPGLSLNLLNCFTPTWRSTSHPEPFKGDFSNENYESLSEVLSPSDFVEYLQKIYTVEELNGELIWTDRHAKQSDLNIARQFMHWYKKKEAELTKKEFK